jgi:hypothetical protein
MKSPDQEQLHILNGLSPAQIRKTLLFLRVLISSEESYFYQNKGLLDELPLDRFVAPDLSLQEVKEAIKVSKKLVVCENDKVDKTKGIATITMPIPKLTDQGMVTGLSSIQTKKLEEILASKEKEFPRNKKINVRVIISGRVLVPDQTTESCSLTQKETEYFKYLRKHVGSSKKLSLKHVAKAVKATDQNASRDIKIINTKIQSAFGVSEKIIGWSGPLGFYLNKEHYNFVFEE